MSHPQNTITISNSTFHRLNAFTNLTAFGQNTELIFSFKFEHPEEQAFFKKAFFEYKRTMNKGIVLNIEGIAGNVEIYNSTFTQNMHYIPELVTITFPYPEFFPEKAVEEYLLDEEKYEYKMGYCFYKIVFHSFFKLLLRNTDDTGKMIKLF